LLGVIVVANDAFRILTRGQIATARGEILKRLGTVIAARSIPIPRFTESGIVKGRFHLASNDLTSHTWLQETVASTAIQGVNDEALHLKLVSPSEVPKLRRAEVFIPGPPASVPEVVTWLQAHNPGMSTERWHLRFCNTTANGQLMVWGIDPNTVKGRKINLVVASSYLPITSDIPSPEMERLVEYCEQQGLPLVIGCDTNAHHLAWGRHECNNRGNLLAEYIATTMLEIANKGCEPTFVSRNRQTVINITLVHLLPPLMVGK
jgi:hypothetical protein